MGFLVCVMFCYRVVTCINDLHLQIYLLLHAIQGIVYLGFQFIWLYEKNVFILLQALSRRATLFEMIRDYAQAASDLRRLVSLLSKGVEDNANQLGISDKSINYTNDLKQNRVRLLEMEEEARKEIPLDMYLIL